MVTFTAIELANANKGTLRGYCRDLGIASTALNVDGMRDALAPHASDYTGNGAATETATETGNDAPAVVDTATENSGDAATVETPPATETATADTSRIAEVATVVPRTAAAVFAANPKPQKAAKVRKPREPRDEANGVKRPAAATLCGRIWSWCDEQIAAGVRPEAAALRDALADIDPTTCTVQYYRWRKFNGIRGR